MAPPATASHLALHAQEVIAPALVGSRARVHFAGENATTAAAAASGVRPLGDAAQAFDRRFELLEAHWDVPLDPRPLE